jgi:hypothetical protein
MINNEITSWTQPVTYMGCLQYKNYIYRRFHPRVLVGFVLLDL